MTRRCVEDAEYAKLVRRALELTRRVDEGTLPFESVMAGLQSLIEGRFSRDDRQFISVIHDWEDFYREVFDFRVDLSALRIPPKREGFNRLIVMAQGLTSNQISSKCSELFPTWRYTENLDAITSDRDPKDGPYALWVRDRQEADEELKNLSANQLKERNIPGITLPERLILELKYWKETGRHLDEKNVTLCSGSRGPRGGVPDVHWGSGGFYVSWCSADYRRDSIRAREAVS